MSVNVRVIKASPERVFEVLADGWLYSSWVVGTSRIRAVSDSWGQSGGTIHHSFGLWPFVINDTTTLDVWNPPTFLRLHAKGGPLGQTVVTIEVKPRGDGSVVRLQEDAVSGLGVLVPRPIRDAVGQVRNHEALRRLAYQVERPRDASSVV
jgi:uncharacterized protein YndB with AHSA1/START domain